MSADVETIIVGAGVIGLAIGRALTQRGQEVLLLERNGQIGAETSSRNSEVIHAGLYYEPGSLRASLCVRGKQMLYAFCRDNGLTCKRSGKLLVATSEDELPALHAIKERARQNGVTDLEFLSARDAKIREPNLACAGACLSPSTGVIDVHGLMLALEGHITSSGGQIVLNTNVETITRDNAGLFVLTTVDTTDNNEAGNLISCKNLVLSAGLGASTIGHTLAYPETAYRVPQTFPAKGHYFTYGGARPFSMPIYPMPVGAWLGVHLTLDVAGQTKFGPDIEWLPAGSDKAPDYRFEDEDKRRAAFASQIRRYFPDLDATLLQPGYTGIRPKIYRDGEPVPDFAIHDVTRHGLPGLVALYGMESPGLTSCLAIGAHVAERL